jgi:prepilin-type N-terminal cleavage/methylation domain-containing protein
MYRSAFTLVELLMVLSLMTIATSIGAIGLARLLDAADDARDVPRVVASADAAARSAAMKRGPIELLMDDDAIVLTRIEDGRRIGRWGLPTHVVTLRDGQGRAAGRIKFEADGRCMSYLVQAADDVWRVCGRTGWIERAGSTP